ncbi:MAG TPA: PEP-CTERM sorting domain-containing protein [Bryobacteraceae bacterium]|nr:PEP-CTERM sorting domain-containing protein [Bryobacteraceae bacterium]
MKSTNMTFNFLQRSITIGVLAAAIQTLGLGATVNFASGDSINEGNFNRTLTPLAPLTPGGNVLITPNSAWEPNHASGGKWVSYGQTDGTVVPPNQFIFNPYSISSTANFLEWFVLDLSSGPVTSATLSVWADDTAAVYMNTTLLQAPLTVQDGACADGIIGCEPGEGLINFDISSALRPGLNVLTIAAYQRDGGPFGVLYEGKISTDLSQVPEPATLGLLGAGLTGILYFSRKRRSIQ